MQDKGMADIGKGTILQTAHTGMKVAGVVGIISRVKATDLFQDTAPVHDITRRGKGKSRMGKMPFCVQPTHKVYKARRLVCRIVTKGSTGRTEGGTAVIDFYRIDKAGQP